MNKNISIGPRHGCVAGFYIWILIVTYLLTADKVSLFLVSLRHHGFNTTTMGKYELFLQVLTNLDRFFFYRKYQCASFKKKKQQQKTNYVANFMAWPQNS